MLKMKFWLIIVAIVSVLYQSPAAAGDETLRILVEKSMTFYGNASLDEAISRVADAGFNKNLC